MRTIEKNVAIREDALMKIRDLGTNSIEKNHEKIKIPDTIAEAADRPKKKKVRIMPLILGISIILAGLIVGIIYFYEKSYYTDRWYEHTKINNIDVSGQTVEEAKNLLLNKMGNYALVIKGRNNGMMTINGEDINFIFSLTSDYEDAFRRQHENFSLFPTHTEYVASFDISYNKKELKNLIKNSDLVKGSYSYEIVKPKSAYVRYSKKTKRYECVPEVLGNQIYKKRFLAAVKENVERGSMNLDLTDEELYPDMYRRPKMTTKNKKLKKKLNVLNQNVLRYVVWNMGKGKVERITPSHLDKWSTYEDGKVTFDENAIRTWVQDLCQRYSTIYKERHIRTHDNRIVTVQPGDYGWQMDFEQTLEQARSSIYQKVSKKDINAYVKNPSEENRKAFIFHKKPAFTGTAFKKDFENYEEDWDPDNYTEVSLKEQMVYVIRNGKVAFSCRCITGRPTSDRSTKPGAYFIKEHQTYRVLRGDNYETPVTNWVRITWTGTGFHEAHWQRWRNWSPTYYQSRGSHGCVNLSVEDSKIIYNLVKYKEAVFIY